LLFCSSFICTVAVGLLLLLLTAIVLQFIVSEGDTVTPGTKVAIISKSAQPAETHVAPSEEATPKESSLPKVEKPKAEERAPKVEPPKKEAPKPSTAPPKTSPSEPQLPPKERERRVRQILSNNIELHHALGFY
jgi:2-oxoglutarate dehydrogenase E2 component (dihydrolipoamide succinyltransferase)